MGNGESTSRRISMQRSDEGTIQISENVMARLKKQKVGPEEEENAVQLLPGERIVDENDLQLMLEKAFHQGVNHGSQRNQVEADTSLQKFQGEMNKKIQEVENLWKTKLEEQEKLSKMQIESVKEHDTGVEEVITEMKKKLMQQEELMNEAVRKISEEKSTLQQQLAFREKDIQDEFNRSVEDVEKKIRPLQQTSVCGEVQSKVLECYRLNKQQPLKCAKEVKDFVECVQSVRMNLLQKKLMLKEREL